MPIVLALSCALVYGIADYCGGRTSRVHPAVVVTLIGQSVSLVLVCAAVLVVGTAVAPAHNLAWGAAGGAVGALGVVAFYWALGHGAMSAVAPTTAVIGAVVPLLAGLAQGERPHLLALVGVIIAVACVALVSGAGDPSTHDHERTPPGVLVAAGLAGVGFGALFVALDHTASASGLWPLVAARVASVPLLLTIVLVGRHHAGSDRGALRFAFVAGVLDMVANALYLAAVHGGLLSIVAVVSSLYPASTVGLAYLVDGERVSRTQGFGLALAAVALALVTLGRR